MQIPHTTTLPLHRDYSNNVLIDNKQSLFFLPAYVRVACIGVQDINIKDLSATFLGTMILTVYYKHLPNELVDELDEIEVSIRNQTILLKGRGQNRNCIMSKKSNSNTIQYSYRGKFPLSLQCDAIMAPFEMLQFSLLMSFHTKIISRGDQQTYIKFNLMDINDMQTKMILFEQKSHENGIYGFAQSSLQISILPNRVPHQTEMRQKLISQLGQGALELNKALDTECFQFEGGLIDNSRILNWRFITYRFKMYRYPTSTIVMVFVPMWILSFINLVVFWAGANQISDRLQTISGLMIAYAALLPTIKDRLPQTPQVTILQYLIYALSFTIFLSSLETLIAGIKFINNGAYSFVWYHNWRFLLSFIITIGTIVIVIFLLIVYKLVWQPRYNFIKRRRFGTQFEHFSVDTARWHNYPASQYLVSKTKLFQNNPVITNNAQNPIIKPNMNQSKNNVVNKNPERQHTLNQKGLKNQKMNSIQAKNIRYFANDLRSAVDGRGAQIQQQYNRRLHNQEPLIKRVSNSQPRPTTNNKNIWYSNNPTFSNLKNHDKASTPMGVFSPSFQSSRKLKYS